MQKTFHTKCAASIVALVFPYTTTATATTTTSTTTATTTTSTTTSTYFYCYYSCDSAHSPTQSHGDFTPLILHLSRIEPESKNGDKKQVDKNPQGVNKEGTKKGEFR